VNRPGGGSDAPGPDRDRLAILAQDLPQHPALLAERDVRGRAAEEVGHQVRGGRLRGRGRFAQACERSGYRARIPVAARALQAREMGLQRTGGHLEERHRGHLAGIDVGVHVDDPPPGP